MKLSLLGHDYQYAVEQIMLVLFPEERPEPLTEQTPEQAGSLCRSELTFQSGKACVKTWLYRDGKSSCGLASVPAPDPADKLVYDRVLQRAVKQSFYKAALPLLDKKPDWGALTGIRPAKLASRALEEGPQGGVSRS